MPFLCKKYEIGNKIINVKNINLKFFRLKSRLIAFKTTSAIFIDDFLHFAKVLKHIFSKLQLAFASY